MQRRCAAKPAALEAEASGLRKEVEGLLTPLAKVKSKAEAKGAQLHQRLGLALRKRSLREIIFGK